MMTKPEGSYISPWTHNRAASTMRNNSRMQEERAAEAASWRRERAMAGGRVGAMGCI